MAFVFEDSSHINLLTMFYSLFCSRRQEKTIMKLVVDAETDKVLGASMCGPDAPEIIQVFFVSYSISVSSSYVCQFYLSTLYNR